MYKTFVKAAAALMLTLVLMVGAFGFVAPSVAHATTDTALETQSVEELKATLIALIRQLLAVLEQQYVAAGGSLDDISSDDDEDEDKSLDDEDEDEDEDLYDDHGDDEDDHDDDEDEDDSDEDDSNH